MTRHIDSTAAPRRVPKSQPRSLHHKVGRRLRILGVRQVGRGDDEGARADAVAGVAKDLLVLDARDLGPLDCLVTSVDRPPGPSASVS